MNNNDWISIDEALPTHNCRVLVFKKGNAPYNDIVEVFYNYYWSYYEEIAPTYWKYIYLPDGTEALLEENE